MPQATQELRNKFLDGDSEAMDVLRENFTISRGGIITVKDADYRPTEREHDAVDYLCDEWDYGYIVPSRTKQGE